MCRRLAARYLFFRELFSDYKDPVKALVFYEGEVIVYNQPGTKVENHQEIAIMSIVYCG
jgi:hypothetical protein